MNELAKRRGDLERGQVEVEEALARSANYAVDAATVAAGLTQFRQVYECLKPFEQKELMHLVLHRTEVWEGQIVLEINGSVPAVLAGTPDRSASRFGTPNWLPGQDSNLQHGG